MFFVKTGTGSGFKGEFSNKFIYVNSGVREIPGPLFFITLRGNESMAEKIVKATHKRRGKVYAWRLPENMSPPPPGSWVLVENKRGTTVVMVKGVQDECVYLAGLRVFKRFDWYEEWLHYRNCERVVETCSFEMERKKWERHGIDMTPYWETGFRVRQLQQLRKGLVMGLRVEKYADPSIPANKMESLRRQEMTKIAGAIGLLPAGASKEQRREILLGLEQGVDVRYYNDISLSAKKMRDIRQCLKHGISGERAQKVTKKEMGVLRLSWEKCNQDEK